MSALPLIVVALALACTAMPAPSRQPSATRSIAVRNAPQELLVQLNDMPIGYRMLSNEPLTLEALTQGQDRSLGRVQLASAGFVSGTRRTFDFAGNSASPPRRATAVLAISKDAAAATIAFDSVVPPADPQITKVGIGETIGDGSIAYRLSPPESSDAAYIVATRYANVVAWFAVVGSSDSIGLKEPAALARKEIAILRADTEGPPLSTPAPRSSPVFPVLFNLALRADDLPSGWKPSAGRTLTINDVAGPGLVQTLSDAGFRSAYSKSFSSPDNSMTVNSLVMLVGSGEKAAIGSRAIANVAVAHGAAEISVGDQVGDGSQGTEGVIADPAAGSSQGTVSRSVYFSSADSISIVTLNSPAASGDARFLVELARKLLAHFV